MTDLMDTLKSYLGNLPIAQDLQPKGPVALRMFATGVLWFLSYEVMAFLGGSLAYHRFPRPAVAHTTEPLPDIGYDLIDFWCPLESPDNIQSMVLLFYYVFFIVRLPFHNKGRVFLQRYLIITSILFLLRTTVVGITSLPNPNPKCSAIVNPVSYWEAIKRVALDSFPPHACGDLLYSGHSACATAAMYLFYYHGLIGQWRTTSFFGCKTGEGIHSRRRRLSTAAAKALDSHGSVRHLTDAELRAEQLPEDSGYFSVNAVGVDGGESAEAMSLPRKLFGAGLELTMWGSYLLSLYSLLSCRSHYTVDVILGFYMAMAVCFAYLRMAEDTDRAARPAPIVWIEGQSLKKQGDVRVRGPSNRASLLEHADDDALNHGQPDCEPACGDLARKTVDSTV